ncbi:hypothetical protein B398_10605 [Xylella fastidiosa 32]|nr:hypothetical protein B398_10605 [Xylella fastidiosa 32]
MPPPPVSGPSHTSAYTMTGPPSPPYKTAGKGYAPHSPLPSVCRCALHITP